MENLKKLVGFRNFLLGLISLTAFWACTKSDDYLKHVEGGEIIYTGKIDSVKVYSGRERVYVTGLFMADPKIVKLTAFWNNGADSVSVPINRTANVDTLKLMIPVPEGIHNFYFVTYDEDNNTSLKVYKTGASFGERYQQGLINRAINAAGHFEGQTTAMAEFGGIDLTSGATFVEMEYTNLDGEKVRARESIDSVEMYFDNCLTTESIRYRTGYLPDSLSVDTFYTEFSQPRMLTVLPYLNNNIHPYASSIWDGSRWGVPANWTVSSSVKNVSQGTYGGWERRGTGGALSLEGGWGLPGVTDGKIYQTIKPKLPAGKYRVSVGAIERGSGGEVYLVAALGATLPNMANVQTSSLAYLNMSSSAPNQYIEFTLTEAQQVSVGFAANMPDSGSYFKVIGSVIFEPVSE